MVERKPVEPQGRNQMAHDKRGQRDRRSLTDAERAKRIQQPQKQTERLPLEHERPNGILVTIVEEDPGDLPQMFPEFVELSHRLLVDQRATALGDRAVFKATQHPCRASSERASMPAAVVDG